MIRKHFVAPAHARLLAELCGPLDEHLRLLEQALQVRLSRQEAAFRIEGAAAAVRSAITLLDHLYAKASKGLGSQDIQLALQNHGLMGSASKLGMPASRHKANQTAAQMAESPAKPVSAAKRGPALKAPVQAQAPAFVSAPTAALADAPTPALRTRHVQLQGRTPNQAQYLQQIQTHDISFGLGPAGTGKTFLAVACAVDALARQAVQRIVLTRPAVEAGERLGFLPGDLAQKVDPYLRPLYDALYDLMGFEQVGRAFEKGQIEVAPLAFMRGRTLNHAFVILDEAQNTTREQMKMFLTRLGFGSRCVVNGDLSQVDLPAGTASGLAHARQVLDRVRGVAFTEFSAADVVRHPLVARIVQAYEADKAAQPEPAARPQGRRQAMRQLR